MNKKCPFCGGEGISWWTQVKSYNQRKRGVNGLIYVKCDFCGAQSKVFPTEADDVDEVTTDEWARASAAWNRRENEIDT